MHLRPYVPADAAPTLEVFWRAIRGTASADYTPEQIEAWADPERDRRAWAAARLAADTVVAVDAGRVVGFSDIDRAGYIDMLFVDPDVARRGIATALLDVATTAARTAGATELTTRASRTARPFFEAHGFTVVTELQPVRRGVVLPCFEMRKVLVSEA